MKTLEILKTRKEEILDLTMDLLSTAINGNDGMFNADLYFFFELDEETKELTVDYFPSAGNISTSDNVFYSIPGHEMPDPVDFGYDSIEEMDFEDCGYREFIENEIEQHILNLS